MVNVSADSVVVMPRTAAVTLQRYGYSVVEAENGRDAVALFEEMKGTVEVVLLDLTMPVMTGEETYRQIKEIDPTVPVIVSSGYDEVEAARRFGAEGLADFIQKPYVAHMLADKVKSAIRHQSAE